MAETMLRMTGAASLALHAVRLLAEENRRRLTTRELASALNVSEAHLAKVVQRLVRAGFVDSARGPRGGLTLAADARARTLLDVYEVIAGPLKIETCLLDERVCGPGECMLGRLFETVNDLARKHLAETTLSDLGTVRRRSGNGGARKDYHG
jgi:Rrf2 family protein